MSDPIELAEEEYNLARAAYEERRRLVASTFAKQAAPAKKERDLAVAKFEAEYQSKVREAKAELAATTRRVRAQLFDFKAQRDAQLRAEERNLEGLLAPLKRERRDALGIELKAKVDEAWQKYHALRWPKP